MKTIEMDLGNARKYYSRRFEKLEKALEGSKYHLYVSTQFPNSPVKNGPGRTPGKVSILDNHNKTIGKSLEVVSFLSGHRGAKKDLIEMCRRKGEDSLTSIIEAIN